MPAPITQTGIKGFLCWFQREQPAIYNKIAPMLPAKVPKAFSNYTSRMKRLRQIYGAGSFTERRSVSMGALADYTLPPIYVTAPNPNAGSPISVDYTATLAAPLPPVDFSSAQAPAGVTFSPVTTAANSGASSTPIANAIAQTVGAASSIYLTNQQAALQQQVVQSQLARAAAGLPPLNTSLNQLGIPTVSSTGFGISSGSMVLLGIAAVVVLALSGGNKKSA